MEPYAYLEEIAAKMDSLQDRNEITRVLDELEFLYEALDPEFQELASELVARLNPRLASTE